MEIYGTVRRLLLGVEYQAILLIGLVVTGFSDTLREFKLPGEQCGGIIEYGDQYKVTSVQFGITTEIAASDNAVTVTSGTTSYPANVSCYITFRTSHKKRFYARIVEFEVENSPRCEKDGLFLYDGATMNDANLIKTHGRYGLCGLTLSLPNYFYTSSNEITFKFVTDGEGNNYRGFEIYATPFRTSEVENCTESEFTCLETGKCITKDAFCNEVYQCEDGSDEPPLCIQGGSPSLIRDRRVGLLVAILFIVVIRASQGCSLI